MKHSKKRKIKFSSVFFSIVLIIGLLFLSVPLALKGYYKIKYSSQIKQYEETAEKNTKSSAEDLINLSHEYNRSLNKIHNKKNNDTKSIKTNDFTLSEYTKKSIDMYADMLKNQKMICWIDIPAIKQKLPVYTGATDDVLQRGAGHMEGTSLPVGGNGTNCVITAHRGLGKNELFKNVDKLKKGDVFYIKNIEKRLTYKVSDIFIVNPGDFSKIKIIPDKDYCTLVTCTPYLSNEKRLIIRGERFKNIGNEENKYNNDSPKNAMIAFIALITVLVIFIKIKSRYRKKSSI